MLNLLIGWSRVQFSSCGKQQTITAASRLWKWWLHNWLGGREPQALHMVASLSLFISSSWTAASEPSHLR